MTNNYTKDNVVFPTSNSDITSDIDHERSDTASKLLQEDRK